jgi:hypothetical protein
MNTTTLTKEQFIADIIAEIKEMSSSDIFDLNNRFCESANYHDSYFYMNDEEFFETYFTKPIDAVRACHFGKWSFADDFVQFNGYGNLESFSYLDADSLPDNVQNIAEYVADNIEEFSDLFTTDSNNYEL